MVITLTIAVFLVGAVWWLESRFSPTVAIMVIGGLFGVICFAAGGLLMHASSRSTLDIAARFNEALAMTEKHRQMTYHEQARGDAAMQRANAQLTVLDAKRVDKLAQERANVLVDLERQRRSAAPKWENDEGGYFQSWD